MDFDDEHSIDNNIKLLDQTTLRGCSEITSSLFRPFWTPFLNQNEHKYFPLKRTPGFSKSIGFSKTKSEDQKKG